MKKIFYTIGIYLTQVITNFALAEDLQSALKQESANEPNFFTIICSLGFVVFLIYITGIIYSKLNIVGSKVAKDQIKNYDLNRAIVISTTQLGQNRNLHVVEINGRCYLIGATPNSVNLIKDLGVSSEYKEQTKKEISEDVEIDEAIQILYGKEILENTEEIVAKEEDQFSVHKKYL
ncbi:MAG: flagellar biosynthetic protein FliO [bacterium]|nr:flagellar biosynthetic protein FliO [bacterium]